MHTKNYDHMMYRMDRQMDGWVEILTYNGRYPTQLVPQQLWLWHSAETPEKYSLKSCILQIYKRCLFLILVKNQKNASALSHHYVCKDCMNCFFFNVTIWKIFSYTYCMKYSREKIYLHFLFDNEGIRICHKITCHAETNLD